MSDSYVEVTNAVNERLTIKTFLKKFFAAKNKIIYLCGAKINNTNYEQSGKRTANVSRLPNTQHIVTYKRQVVIAYYIYHS